MLELRSLSENFKLEVGTRAMDALFSVLKTYNHDFDLLVVSFDILANILNCNSPVSSDSSVIFTKLDKLLSEQLCEILLKGRQNVEILIDTLDNTNFQIRWAVIKIFIAISRLQLGRFQEILNDVHFGLTRIVEFLRESREMLRNDCIILLMLLSQNDKNMQKVLAFDNIFEKLFEIIEGEGGVEGGIVTHDCVVIMRNILTSNSCTQKHFRELGLISRLTPYVKVGESLSNSIDTWPTSRLNNVTGFVDVVRVFLDPLGVQQSIIASQKVVFSSGVLKCLFELLPPSALPESLSIEACLATADALRENQVNQDTFFTWLSQAHSGQDPVFTLLVSLVSPKVSLPAKHAIMYLFQCLVHSNGVLCEKIVRSLVECEKVQDSPDLPRALCAGFFDHDSVLCWVSCACLIRVLLCYPLGKKQLLKVHFLVDDSSQHPKPISLLERCLFLIKAQNISMSARISILSFLTTMTYDCPSVLSEFLKLNGATALPLTGILDITANSHSTVRGLYAVLLVVYLTFSEEPIRSEILRSVTAHLGLTDVKILVSELVQDSGFVACSKSPRPVHQPKSYFDFEFTGIVKKVELMANDLLVPESSSTTFPLGIFQTLLEKNSEIDLLKVSYRSLEAKVKQLEASLSESLEKERLAGEWKMLHQELNGDFQKLIADHQELLTVLDSQETLIRDLKAQATLENNKQFQVVASPAIPREEYPQYDATKQELASANKETYLPPATFVDNQDYYSYYYNQYCDYSYENQPH